MTDVSPEPRDPRRARADRAPSTRTKRQDGVLNWTMTLLGVIVVLAVAALIVGFAAKTLMGWF